MPAILEIKKNGVLFEEALFVYETHHRRGFQGAVLLQKPSNYFPHRTGLVAFFLQGINAAPDENEAIVFDELVVYRLNVRRFLIQTELVDILRDIPEMKRPFVFLQNQINFVADRLRLDLGPLFQTEIAEDVRAEMFRNRKKMGGNQIFHMIQIKLFVQNLFLFAGLQEICDRLYEIMEFFFGFFIGEPEGLRVIVVLRIRGYTATRRMKRSFWSACFTSAQSQGRE